MHGLECTRLRHKHQAWLHDVACSHVRIMLLCWVVFIHMIITLACVCACAGVCVCARVFCAFRDLLQTIQLFPLNLFFFPLTSLLSLSFLSHCPPRLYFLPPTFSHLLLSPSGLPPHLSCSIRSPPIPYSHSGCNSRGICCVCGSAGTRANMHGTCPSSLRCHGSGKQQHVQCCYLHRWDL